LFIQIEEFEFATLTNVCSVYGIKRGPSILSFDLNANDVLAFSTDLESIYCTEL
jgi:hypothetical protein